MAVLNVNIDHVATVRQARRTDEPDPVWAAVQCELAGANGITVHLRQDRRHINDRDVEVLKETVACKFNLEMSLAEPIVKIAERVVHRTVAIVPERREELTTKAGWIASGQARLAGGQADAQEGYTGEQLYCALRRHISLRRRRWVRCSRAAHRGVR